MQQICHGNNFDSLVNPCACSHCSVCFLRLWHRISGRLLRVNRTALRLTCPQLSYLGSIPVIMGICFVTWAKETNPSDARYFSVSISESWACCMMIDRKSVQLFTLWGKSSSAEKCKRAMLLVIQAIVWSRFCSTRHFTHSFTLLVSHQLFDKFNLHLDALG